MAAVNDTGSYEFTLEFENCGVDLGNLELLSDWDAAAKAITTWLEKQPGIAPAPPAHLPPMALLRFPS